MKATAILQALPDAANVKIGDIKTGLLIYEGRAGDAPAYAFSNTLHTYQFFEYPAQQHVLFVELTAHAADAWAKAQSA